MWYGVDINNEDIADNFESCVWEPAIVKINAITAATEAACLILSVDETVKNPKSGGTPSLIMSNGAFAQGFQSLEKTLGTRKRKARTGCAFL